MPRQFLCAGNWKLNKNSKETSEFLKELLQNLNKEDEKRLIIFAPAVNLLICSEELKDSEVGFGAQNIFFENSGAFTGETSPQVVFEMGARHCLVGHSERRQYFGETSEFVCKKVRAIQKENMVPMVCIGETLEQRESEQTKEVLESQIEKALEKLDISKTLIIAYEPIWAIGTGRAATAEEAEEAHVFIRKFIEKKKDSELARKTSILYGGSVKPENAVDLAVKENIDGFLVGGASLRVKQFLEIFYNLKQVKQAK